MAGTESRIRALVDEHLALGHGAEPRPELQRLRDLVDERRRLHQDRPSASSAFRSRRRTAPRSAPSASLCRTSTRQPAEAEAGAAAGRSQPDILAVRHFIRVLEPLLVRTRFRSRPRPGAWRPPFESGPSDRRRVVRSCPLPPAVCAPTPRHPRRRPRSGVAEGHPPDTARPAIAPTTCCLTGISPQQDHRQSPPVFQGLPPQIPPGGARPIR